MSGIIRLKAADFEIVKGVRGAILSTKILGIALVMFWSPNCPISGPLEYQYRRLPQIIPNVKFCTVNVNEQLPVINLSAHTISPIKEVPYIVFYVNGKPFLSFDDDPTIARLGEFVAYALKLVESQRKHIEKGGQVVAENQNIYGKPYSDLTWKCTDQVCYLNYKEAYNNQTSSRGNVSDDQMSGRPGR